MLSMRIAEREVAQLICPCCKRPAAANHIFCGNCGTILSALNRDTPTMYVNRRSPSSEHSDPMSGKQTKHPVPIPEMPTRLLDTGSSVIAQPKSQTRISRRRSLQLLGGIAVLATTGLTSGLMVSLRERLDAQASVPQAQATHQYTYHSNQGPVSSVVWDPLGNGQTASLPIAFCSKNSSNVPIWDGLTGKQALPTYSYRKNATSSNSASKGITSLAWCHSGHKIVLGDQRGTAQIWAADSATYTNTQIGHTASVLSVDWAKDGRHIATGSEDMNVGIWTLQLPGDQAKSLWGRGHTGPVNVVRFSHDSNYVVSVSDDGTARIWRVQDGTSLYTYSGHKKQDYIRAVACYTSTRQPLSSNLLIATGSFDKTVRVWGWNPWTGQATDLQCYTGHQAAVTSLAWLPNSKIIASGDIWGQLHLWQSDTGKPLLILPDAHTDMINALAWSSQGDYLASAGQDQIVRVYQIELPRI